MKARELIGILGLQDPDATLMLPDGEKAVGIEHVSSRSEAVWITSRSDYPDDPEDEEYILQTVTDFIEVLGDAPEAAVLLHSSNGPAVVDAAEGSGDQVILHTAACQRRNYE